MKVLVTGGAGFIGSHLVRWLCSQGHRVLVLDNFSTGKQERLTSFQAEVTLIEGDICDFEVVKAAISDVDLVFHLAAMVSLTQSVEEPLLAHAINTTGTLHILEAARGAGVKRVVQMSSCSIYGEVEKLPINEADSPRPLSPYALSKLGAEQLGQLYFRLYGLETVALRGFNIYGPGQDPTSPYAAVIPRFIATFQAGQQPIIYGDGLQTRDFIFVEDVVQALWLAATAPKAAGEVFNVGAGKSHSILSLAQMIGDMMEMPVQPQFVPPRSGEVRDSCADISLFTECADFQPRFELAEGLKKTISV